MTVRHVPEQTEDLLNKIVEVVNIYLHPKRIILFGSKAAGKGREYSDFDIAVEGAVMTIRNERMVKETFDEMLGIYTVDLINLDNADSDFKRLVLEKGKVIYGQ